MLIPIASSMGTGASIDTADEFFIDLLQAHGHIVFKGLASKT
jgi:hypothetical protein